MIGPLGGWCTAPRGGTRHLPGEQVRAALPVADRAQQALGRGRGLAIGRANPEHREPRVGRVARVRATSGCSESIATSRSSGSRRARSVVWSRAAIASASDSIGRPVASSRVRRRRARRARREIRPAPSCARPVRAPIRPRPRAARPAPPARASARRRPARRRPSPGPRPARAVCPSDLESSRARSPRTRTPSPGADSSSARSSTATAPIASPSDSSCAASRQPEPGAPRRFVSAACAARRRSSRRRAAGRRWRARRQLLGERERRVGARVAASAFSSSPSTRAGCASASPPDAPASAARPGNGRPATGGGSPAAAGSATPPASAATRGQLPQARVGGLHRQRPSAPTARPRRAPTPDRCAGGAGRRLTNPPSRSAPSSAVTAHESRPGGTAEPPPRRAAAHGPRTRARLPSRNRTPPCRGGSARAGAAAPAGPRTLCRRAGRGASGAATRSPRAMSGRARAGAPAPRPRAEPGRRTSSTAGRSREHLVVRGEARGSRSTAPGSVNARRNSLRRGVP